MATTYPSPQLQPPTIPSSSTQPLFLGPPLKNTDSFRTRFRQSRAARVSSHYCCCFPLSSGIWVLSIFLLVSTPSLLPTNKPSTQPTNQPTSVMSQHHPTRLSTPSYLASPSTVPHLPLHCSPLSLRFSSLHPHKHPGSSTCAGGVQIYICRQIIIFSLPNSNPMQNIHLYFYAQYTPHSLLDLTLPLDLYLRSHPSPWCCASMSQTCNPPSGSTPPLPSRLSTPSYTPFTPVSVSLLRATWLACPSSAGSKL